MSKEEFPDIGEQGKNLAKFTVKVVKDAVINTGSDNEGGVFVSDAKNKERCNSREMKLHNRLMNNNPATYDHTNIRNGEDQSTCSSSLKYESSL